MMFALELHPQLLKQELIPVVQAGLKLLVPCLLIAVDGIPLCATLDVVLKTCWARPLRL